MDFGKISISGIPAIIWGKPCDAAYIFVHGKMSNKESAGEFAQIAQTRGYQTLSFDLPAHGERQDRDERCDIWTGMRDLALIGDYARAHWGRLNLFACSLGAYFSLMTYPDMPFQKCLFLSPIADMNDLIAHMFAWFDVTPARLESEREIPTPVDTLSWKYYRYALENPITRWPFPTSILHAAEDNLQSSELISEFARRFHCAVTEAQGAEHSFMGEGQGKFVTDWMQKSI